MKNTDSGNEKNTRMDDVLAIWDDLTLPPAAAEILKELGGIYKRRTLRQLCRVYHISHLSRSTVRKYLRQLVASGRVRRHGKGKATWYTL